MEYDTVLDSRISCRNLCPIRWRAYDIYNHIGEQRISFTSECETVEETCGVGHTWTHPSQECNAERSTIVRGPPGHLIGVKPIGNDRDIACTIGANLICDDI